MSKKCKAYSASKLGIEAPDNRKAFYAGWDAAMLAAEPEQPADEPVCPICKGTGEMDSGGTHPWGWPINIACECTRPQPAVSDEPVAKAWDEGYRAGINDERMSEASIGIAGFGAKVEPARNNPYHTRPATREEKIVRPSVYEVNVEPQTNDFNPDWMCTCGDLTALNVVHRKDAPCYYPDKREWVGLTDEEIHKCYETTGHYQTLRPQDRFAVFALARAIEVKLKEKNT